MKLRWRDELLRPHGEDEANAIQTILCPPYLLTQEIDSRQVHGHERFGNDIPRFSVPYGSVAFRFRPVANSIRREHTTSGAGCKIVVVFHKIAFSVFHFYMMYRVHTCEKVHDDQKWEMANNMILVDGSNVGNRRVKYPREPGRDASPQDDVYSTIITTQALLYKKEDSCCTSPYISALLLDWWYRICHHCSCCQPTASSDARSMLHVEKIPAHVPQQY